MACCVSGCKNRTSKESDLHFYRVPKDPQRRALWLKAARRLDLLQIRSPGPQGPPRTCRRVCSVHFITGKHSDDPTHPDYVPSVFSFSNEQEQNRSRSRSGSKKRRKAVAQMKLVEQVYGLQDGDIIPFIYNPPEGSTETGTTPEGSTETGTTPEGSTETGALISVRTVQTDLEAQAQENPVRDHNYCLSQAKLSAENADKTAAQNIDSRTDKQTEDRLKHLKFLCSMCGFYFESLEMFLAHFDRHSDFRNVCKICGKKFDLPCRLRTHELVHSERRPYSCSVCDKSFKSRIALKVHHHRVHAEARFHCALCQRSFKAQQLLDRHLSRHKDRPTKAMRARSAWAPRPRPDAVVLQTEDGPSEKDQTSADPPETLSSPKMSAVSNDPPKAQAFVCSVCDKSFRHEYCLIVHRRIHSRPQPIECSVCSKRLCSKYSLLLHQRTHSGEKPFSCSLCSSAFALKGTLHAHMASKHTGKTFECGECGRKFATKPKLNFHLKTHAQDKPYSCSVCLQAFESLEAAEEHLPLHKNETESGTKSGRKVLIKYLRKQYLCSECGKTFNQKVNLDNHMRVHSDTGGGGGGGGADAADSIFSCSVCGVKLKNKNSLALHMRLHTGEKPFSCSVCLQAFRQKGSLALHMLIHSGARPHVCDLCGAAFRQKSSLKTHALTHSGERPYACALCPRRYKSAPPLNQHMRVAHGPQLHRCSTCHMTFMKESSLTKHMVRKHPHLSRDQPDQTLSALSGPDKVPSERVL